MILAGCTTAVVVCDDTGTVTDGRFLLLQAVALLVLAAVAAALLVRLARRRRRTLRAPASRVWISADGDVVRKEPG